MGRNLVPAAAAWSIYYEKLGKTNVWRCRAPNCQFSIDRGVHLDTYNIKKHLKEAHPELYQRREEALSKVGKPLPNTSLKRTLQQITQIGKKKFGEQPKAKHLQHRFTAQHMEQEQEEEEGEEGEGDYLLEVADEQSNAGNNNMSGGLNNYSFPSATVHSLMSAENNGDHSHYEVGNNRTAYKEEVGQQHFFNGNGAAGFMAAAFENDDGDQTGNNFCGSGEETPLESRLKMAKIAFFEAQTEYAMEQANEARSRAKTEIVRAKAEAARERESVARESEARANERVANLRARLLELEYQEKTRNSVRSSMGPMGAVNLRQFHNNNNNSING